MFSSLLPPYFRVPSSLSREDHTIWGNALEVHFLICHSEDGPTPPHLAFSLGKSTGVLQGEMKRCSWFRHLPASIVAFQPALRTLAHPISQEYLQDTLQQWIRM